MQIQPRPPQWIALFKRLDLVARLRRCFAGVDSGRVYGLARGVPRLGDGERKFAW